MPRDSLGTRAIVL